MSQKVLALPHSQKPSTAMSALAPLSLLTDLPRVSPLSSCSSCSTLSFEHISVKNEAVRSLMLSSLRVGKPPLLQDKACSTVNLLPHTHSVGSSLGIQPYRRAMASRKVFFTVYIAQCTQVRLRTFVYVVTVRTGMY